MRRTLSIRLRGGLVLLAAFVVPIIASAATPLFPRPLHLTRAIEDSTTGKTSVIEEYCYGNRVASISGDRTVIVDYEKQEIIEISFADATYSVMRFEEFARFGASAGVPVKREAITENSWTVRPSAAPSSAKTKGVRTNASVSAEYVEVSPRGTSPIRRIELGIDRSVSLSKDAIDVLTGSAYPHTPTIEGELTVRAAAPVPASGNRLQANSVSTATTVYGLPIEQNVTYRGGAEELVMRMRITSVEEAEPPRDKVTPPPGAKLVPSRITETLRTLGDIERSTPQN